MVVREREWPPEPVRARRRWRTGAIGLVVSASVLVLGARPTMPADADFRPVAGRERRDLLLQVTRRVNEVRCGLVTVTGTAVALADGRLLTNRHVVDGALGINVVPHEGLTATGSGWVSPTADVGLIAVPDPPGVGLDLAPRDPHAGATVTVAGYPHGDDALLIATARVVDRVDGSSRGQPGAVLRLDYRASGGMSGGPVLDAAGRLAGVLYAVEDDTGYSLVIPASALRDALTGGGFVPARRC